MIYSAMIAIVLLCLMPGFALKMSQLSANRVLRLRAVEDEYTVAVLGDLHLDPRFMDDHISGREHILKVLEDGKRPNSCVVSLGDLGESKSVDETTQLFAGTSSCFKLARDYLEGFKVPFEVVGGNHDLEGIDEFASDEENLKSYLKAFDKPTPYFQRLIAKKTLLIGLGSVLFREALYTSHEVFIGDEQVRWFEDTVKACPAEDGWRVLVFSHAPPMGSGLRVLQENHVVNGCCWLNHSNKNNGKFIDIVRKNPSIKAWFSGHFHLGQDYQDSITFPEGHNRGSCVFVQTAVMSKRSSRDGRQQSRLVRGTKEGFTISTINHKKGGEERLDATAAFLDSSHESVVCAHASEDYDHAAWFSAYTPQAEDGCYVDDLSTGLTTATEKGNAVCWWHMACGRVLGVHSGMLLEYDPSTLAPLGLVVGRDELAGRQVAVIDSGSGVTKENAAAFEEREQAVVLYSDVGDQVTVVQPNEDGSYWRKIVRNKVIRMKEKRREQAAREFAKSLGADASLPVKVKSTWGPSISTAGTARNTDVKIAE
jgi:hypothetical protein